MVILTDKKSLFNATFAYFIVMIAMMSSGLGYAGDIDGSMSWREDLLHSVSVVGRPDRMTLKEYAAANDIALDIVEKTFQPTGMLKCGKHVATANIVLKSDVIITADHVFKEEETCKAINDPKRCVFTTAISGVSFKSNVKRKVGGGFDCSRPRKPDDDWAVLVLEKPAPNLVPYLVQDYPVVDLNSSVTTVAASSSDFYNFDSISGKRIYPKHVGDAEVRHVYRRRGSVNYFQTDADTSFGASGGGVLLHGTSIIVGIVKSSDETAMQNNAATKDTIPHPTMGEFVDGHWATYNVAISGAFFGKIKEAANSGGVVLLPPATR